MAYLQILALIHNYKEIGKLAEIAENLQSFDFLADCLITQNNIAVRIETALAN